MGRAIQNQAPISEPKQPPNQQQGSERDLSPNRENVSGIWLARGLVVLQFGLAAWLVLDTNWRDVPGIVRQIWTVMNLGVGSSLAVWAWWVMGIHHLRIMPHPAAHGTLLTRGPYRRIRHPMYSGLLIASLGCVSWDMCWLRTAGWLGLAAVLICKTQIEESLLRAKYPEYASYRLASWRFFPGIW